MSPPKIALTLFLFYCASSICLAQGDSWSEKQGMGTARLGHAAVSFDGKVYVFGGYASATSAGLTTTEVYDPASDSWQDLAPMPTGRRWVAAAEIGGIIYVVGGHVGAGQPGLSTLEAYDPATDTWTTKADMPTPRLALAAASVGGKLYAIGGTSSSSPLATVEEYDPATDSWASKADMARARVLLSATAVDEHVYAIGGMFAPGGSGYSDVEEYDPVTDSWESRAGMPTARGTHAAAAAGGSIFAIAGRDGNDVTIAVEEYRPASDTWESRSAFLDLRRWGVAGAAIDDRVYVVGGAEIPQPPHPAKAENFEYAIPVGSSQTSLVVTPDTLRYPFDERIRIINTDTGSVTIDSVSVDRYGVTAYDLILTTADSTWDSLWASPAYSAAVVGAEIRSADTAYVEIGGFDPCIICKRGAGVFDVDTLFFHYSSSESPATVFVDLSGYVANERVPSIPTQFRMETYPNPVADELTVSIESNRPANVGLEVYDVLGRLIWRSGVQFVSDRTFRISTRELSPGVFFVRSETTAGYVVTRSVVVTR